MTHAEVMQAYYAAREAWELAAETASHGYATEWAEYKRDNPPPTLKQFLVGLRQERRAA